MNNIFHSNACPVCQAYGRDANLKRCSNCRMIGYCSREHQREHWPRHKDICKILGNRIKQHGSVFPPKGEKETIDSRSWSLRKQELMNFALSQLGRQFLYDEEKMLLHARSCEVCHETNPQELVDCPDCPSVSFCKKHINAEHQEKCKQTQLVRKGRSEPLDNCIKFSTLNIGPNIPKDMEGVADCYHKHYSKKITSSTEMPLSKWINVNMELIWRPYTFLYCLEKISTSTFPCNIHILAGDPRDTLTVAGWEVLLHHAKLPKDVAITYIGPEIKDHVNFAKLGKNRKILVNTVRKPYQDYVNSYMYTKPDVVVGFNIAIHSFIYDWAPTIKEIEKIKCPFFLTAMVEIDITIGRHTINNVLDKDVKPAYSGRNPYHGVGDVYNMRTREVTRAGLYLVIYDKL